MLAGVKSQINKILTLTNGRKSNLPVLNNRLIEQYNLSRKNGPHDSLCNAPLTNMYFGQKGNVSACCFNRTHLLGSYPEMNIKDIWKSPKANELRKLLKSNNLSSGCHSCASLITKMNFDGVVAKNYDDLPINRNYPSKLEFELSNTCNLECKMCFGEFSSLIRKNRENKPPIKSSYDKRFVEQIKEFIPHIKSARFFGGEPFLIDIYYDIWNLIIKLNPSCQIVVQTNGTILNNRVKKLLSLGNFKINLSIDSLVKESYESIRVNAKYQTIMKNMQYFNQYCKSNNTNLGLSVCPLTTNWKEIPELLYACNNLEAFIYFNVVWYPKDLSLSQLPSKKLQEINSYLAKFHFPDETMVQKSNLQHYNDYNNLIKGWANIADEKERNLKRNEKSMERKERILEKKLKKIEAVHLTTMFNKKVEIAFMKVNNGKTEGLLNILDGYLKKTNVVFGKFTHDLQFKKAINTLNEEPDFEPVIEVLANETEDQIYSRVKELYQQKHHSK